MAEKLPGESALLEFARIPTVSDDGKERLLDRYIVFVLHADDGGVGMIDLGDAERIDRMGYQYIKEITEPGKGGEKTGQQVYDLVFKPLMEELGDVTHIFISPDGYLNLIPFEVIQQPNGRFLVQDYTFNYLATGRDILGFDDSLSIKGKVLLMGDPDFNLELNEKKALLSEMHLNEPDKIQLAKRSVNLNEVAFEPLPHARAELEAIGRIMGRDQSRIYTGKQAIEEMLTSGPAPEILHLATHGFFLTDQNAASSGRGWQTVDLPDEKSSQRIQRQIDTINPLLRSGILLAGARRSLMTDDMATNDGIVTAEKVLGMNLHGTKMVVLSACDTGLGDVWSGEGVFGLRRAFTQAGAQSLVMSLWKVPDKETKELMVRFYENFKSEAMDRCQALRLAILEQMKIVEQRHGYPDPLYWGAFVFMGKP